MVDVAAERGLANASVAHVVARAGVSRRTFYDLFEDREDCFLAALDSAIALASERVLVAYDPALGWRERVRQGLLALLEFFDAEPTMGRLLIVESLGAGPAAIQRRAGILRVLIAAIDEGRREQRSGPKPTALTAEGVAGAVFSVIHARIVEPEHRPLVELAGPLMSIIVQPYLGSAAAQREARRPTPKRKPTTKVSHNPLKGLEMRLTYRTVWVLLSVGAHPGASNKEIGVASGAEDQGQISKLLSRLERLGLIQNSGAGQAKGAPNAWTLTPRGEEVNAALATQTSNRPLT